MHKWIGEADWERFDLTANVLCRTDQRTVGNETMVTTKDEDVTCTDCLERMYVDLVVEASASQAGTQDGVLFHSDPQQLGGCWVKIKNGAEVATIFLTNEQLGLIERFSWISQRRNRYTERLLNESKDG